MDATKKRRWYCPTPGWLVLGSLAVTGLLWLSNWLGWPAWHKGYAVRAAVAGVGMVLVLVLLARLAGIGECPNGPIREWLTVQGVGSWSGSH